MMKKLLSILLSMLMVLSFMPTSAFAEGEADLPVCVCETVCTVESMNTECPVCGDDGALPESCGQYIPAEDGQTDEPDNDPAEEDSDTVEQTSSEVAVTLTLLLPDGLSAEGMESVDEFTNKLMRTVGEDGKIAPVVLSCEDEGAFSAELAAALSETDAFKSSTLTAEYDETGDTLTISGAPAESAELDMNAILTVAMAAMGAYGAAPAEDDHTHCICGGENSVGDHTTHTNVTWTGISSLSEIAAEGNYYLKNDVTSGTWTCRIAGVKLCLNGKTITGTRDFVELINISAVASLAITDCQETVGKITNNGVEGSCIYNYGILTLWNGSITGSRRGVDNDNTFTMNGGSIRENRYPAGGGGVANSGTFTMNGGSITDNKARHGGGVENDGTFTMTGGSITQNHAGIKGGGVNNWGTFTMTGGSITGNYNDGIYNNDSEYNNYGSTVKLSGNVNITGNVRGGTLKNGVYIGGTSSNVYLPNGKPVTVESGKPLAATAKVGITAENPASYPTVVTGTMSTTGFFSDNANYQLIDNGSNGLLLAEVITFSGVKLLNETGGEEMTGGKTYDGKAVAYDDSGVSYTPTVLGVSLTYTWQKLNGETYSDLTAAPKAAGSYRLLVSAVKNGYTLGTQELAFTISPKPLTVENLKVADKTYDGTDKAKIIGTPTPNDVVGTDDVMLVLGTPSFTSVNVGENITIRFTEFTLTGTDKSNYTLIQPSGITASITAYSADGTEYSVNSNDWLNVDFVVTAAEDWQLSYTNTAEGDWVSTLTVSEENNNGRLEFYLKNTSTGAISEKVTEHYKIDKTAPAGEVRIDERNAWQTFVNAISFNLFYKDAQTVTVTANDNGSGIAKIEYLVTADVLTVEQLADKTFKSYSSTFGIEPDAKLIVYARITDAAGNMTYLRSDGIVLDSTAPVINGADNGKTYCEAVTLTVTDEYLDTVTLNGEPVTLTDGKLTVNPAEGRQTAIATDKAGNSISITVTVNDGHTWGEWVSNGDNTHTRVCSVNAKHAETDDCHGGTATCKDKAVCVVCGEEYGDLAPHELTHIAAKAATTAEFGNTEYWHCDVCNKYFSDEKAENEIALADTVISKLAPKIIAGDGATVTQGEKKALSFTSDAAFDDFLRVEVDGKTVNESSYTVKSGSTVVTLNADYVATLSVGEHTLGIVSESGTATAKFTVNKKAAETTGKTDKPDTNDKTTSPKTGDSSNLALWIALLFVSGGAAIGTTVVSRKKKYNK